MLKDVSHLIIFGRKEPMNYLGMKYNLLLFARQEFFEMILRAKSGSCCDFFACEDKDVTVL